MKLDIVRHLLAIQQQALHHDAGFDIQIMLFATLLVKVAAHPRVAEIVQLRVANLPLVEHQPVITAAVVGLQHEGVGQLPEHVVAELSAMRIQFHQILLAPQTGDKFTYLELVRQGGVDAARINFATHDLFAEAGRF